MIFLFSSDNVFAGILTVDEVANKIDSNIVDVLNNLWSSDGSNIYSFIDTNGKNVFLLIWKNCCC